MIWVLSEVFLFCFCLRDGQGILGGTQLILWSKVESSNLKNVECGIYEAQITDFDFTPCLMPKGVYDVNIL